MKKTSKPVDKEQLINQIKIDLLTAYFPFSNEDIIKYQEVLNFDEYQIFLNPNINWNTKLIKTVKDKLAHNQNQMQRLMQYLDLDIKIIGYLK